MKFKKIETFMFKDKDCIKAGIKNHNFSMIARNPDVIYANNRIILAIFLCVAFTYDSRGIESF